MSLEYLHLDSAQSLVQNGNFTQGSAFWFGSYLRHHDQQSGPDSPNEPAYALRMQGGLARDFPDVTQGANQFIDRPDIFTYPSERSVTNVRLQPVSSTTAVLITTGSTLIDGQALVPGIVGAMGSAAFFQHPFLYRDEGRVIKLVLGSELTIRSTPPQQVKVGRFFFADSDEVAVVHHAQEVYGTFEPFLTAGAVNADYHYFPPTQVTTIVFSGDGVEAALDILVGDVIRLGDSSLSVKELSSGVADGSYVIKAVSLYAGTARLAAGISGPGSAGTDWDVYREDVVRLDRTLPLYQYSFTVGQTYATFGEFNAPASPEISTRVLTDTGLTGIGEIGALIPHVPNRSFEVELAKNADGDLDMNWRRRLDVYIKESAEPLDGRLLLTMRPDIIGDAGYTRDSVTLLGQEDFDGQSVLVSSHYEDVELGAPVDLVTFPTVGGVDVVVCYFEPGTGNHGFNDGDVVYFTGNTATSDPLNGQTFSNIEFHKILDARLPDSQLPLPFVASLVSVNNTFGLQISADAVPGFDHDVDAFGTSTSSIRVSTTPPTHDRIIVDDFAALEGLTGTTVPFFDDLRPAPFVVTRREVTEFSPAGATVKLFGSWPLDYDVNTVVDTTGEQLRIFRAVPNSQQAYIGDVAMFPGIRAAELSVDDDTADISVDSWPKRVASEDIVPKGTIVMYAGGGVCPPGYKRIDGFRDSEAFDLGVRQQILPLPDEAVPVVYDPVLNQSTLSWVSSFPIAVDGSLAVLEGYGGTVELAIPTVTEIQTVTVEAQRQIFQPGMTLRIPEVSYPGGTNSIVGTSNWSANDYLGPLTDVSKNHLIEDLAFDLSEQLGPVESAKSWINSAINTEDGQSTHGEGQGTIVYPDLTPSTFQHPDLATMAAWASFPNSGAVTAYPGILPAGPDLRRQTERFPGAAPTAIWKIPNNGINTARTRLRGDTQFNADAEEAVFIDGTVLTNSTPNAATDLIDEDAIIRTGDVFCCELYGAVPDANPNTTGNTRSRFIGDFIGVVTKVENTTTFYIDKYDQGQFHLLNFDGNSVNQGGSFPAHSANGNLASGGYIRAYPAKLYGLAGVRQALVPNPGAIPAVVPGGLGASQVQVKTGAQGFIWVNRILTPSVRMIVAGEVIFPANLVDLIIEPGGYLMYDEPDVFLDYGDGSHTHAIEETNKPGATARTPRVRAPTLGSGTATNPDFIASYDGPYNIPGKHNHSRLAPRFALPKAASLTICEKL